jgi:hypothetical protein
MASLMLAAARKTRIFAPRSRQENLRVLHTFAIKLFQLVRVREGEKGIRDRVGNCLIISGLDSVIDFFLMKPDQIGYASNSNSKMSTPKPGDHSYLVDCAVKQFSLTTVTNGSGKP